MYHLFFGCQCRLFSPVKHLYCPEHRRPCVALGKSNNTLDTIKSDRILFVEEPKPSDYDIIVLGGYHPVVNNIPHHTPILLDGPTDKIQNLVTLLKTKGHIANATRPVINCTEVITGHKQSCRNIYYETSLALFNIDDTNVSRYPYRGHSTLFEQYVPKEMRNNIESVLHLSPNDNSLANHCLKTGILYSFSTESSVMHNHLADLDNYSDYISMRGLP